MGAGLMAVFGLLPWAAKTVVTLPLALVLPGHALLAALNRPDRGLGAGGRIACGWCCR